MALGPFRVVFFHLVGLALKRVTALRDSSGKGNQHVSLPADFACRAGVPCNDMLTAAIGGAAR